MSVSASLNSRLSQKSVEWERSRAAGSAAVDLTNLVLNPQKPSAINVWQVMSCPETAVPRAKRPRVFALASPVRLAALADEPRVAGDKEQGAHGSIYQHGPPRSGTAFRKTEDMYDENQEDLDRYRRPRLTGSL